MSRASDRAAAYLQRNLDETWTDVDANADVLSEDTAELDWPCRVTAIDWFVWQLGTRLLDEDEAEAVIDRDRGEMRASPAVARFVEVARHTIAAVMLRLDQDNHRIVDAYQAALFAVSPLAAHRAAFDQWIEAGGPPKLAEAFRGLPGHAFLAMAAEFDDTAIALIARDAFWTTMLGRSAYE